MVPFVVPFGFWTVFVALPVTILSGSIAVFLPTLGAGVLFAGATALVVRSHLAEQKASGKPGTVTLGTWRDSATWLNRPYVLPASERLRHLVVFGPTGSGKSTLLRRLILNDVRSGAGLCAIDPKDNLIDGLLPYIPRNRIQDIILMDIADTEMPIGFNPLSGIPAERRTLAVNETISVLRRYFADSWGARLEHILTNVILALLETPDTTLLDVRRLLAGRAVSPLGVVARHQSWRPAVLRVGV